MKQVKCPRCGQVHKFGSQEELKKAIIEHEVRFWGHEEVGADMVEAILRRLKYPLDIIKKVKIAVKAHMRTKTYGAEADKVSDKALRKLKADLGDHLQTTLDLIHADNISHADDYNMPMQIPKLKDRLKKLENEPTKPKLPIDGNDVMKRLKIKPGPMIKELLKGVEEAYFENPNLTKQQAYAIIDRMYKTIGK